MADSQKIAKRCLNCMETHSSSLTECPFCGFKESEAETPANARAAGAVLQGRYILGTCKGIRDVDIYYTAWDALFDRKVLIQEFFPQRIAERNNDGMISPKEGMEEEFLRCLNVFYEDRKNMIRLYKANDILPVLSCFTDNGTAYASMQYPGNITLAQYSEENGPLELSEVMRFMADAVTALGKLHRLNRIHGAVNTSSFCVTERTGKLVLLGFAEPQHLCGDPDQKDYGNPSEATDVYGVAMMAACLLSGRPCVSEEEALKEFNGLRKKTSQTVINTLKKAITSEPSERIMTLKEFSAGIFGEVMTMTLMTEEIGENGVRSTGRDGKGKLSTAGIAVITAVCVLLAAGGGFGAYKLMNKAAAEIAVEVSDEVEELASDIEKIEAAESSKAEESSEAESTSEDSKEVTELSEQFLAAVPEVAGLDGKEAEEALKNADLAVVTGDDLNEFSHDIKKGAVIRLADESGKEITTGTELEKNTEIRMILSKGPEMIEIPGKIAYVMSGSEAKEKLQGLGFKVSMKEAYGSADKGKVETLQPEEGKSLEKGSEVVVTVSLGKKPVETKAQKKETKAAVTKAAETKAAETKVPETKESEPKTEEVKQEESDLQEKQGEVKPAAEAPKENEPAVNDAPPAGEAEIVEAPPAETAAADAPQGS